MDLYFHLKHPETLVDDKIITIQKEMTGKDFQNIKDFVEIGLKKPGLCGKKNKQFSTLSFSNNKANSFLQNNSFLSVDSKECSTQFDKVNKIPKLRYLTCGLFGSYIDQIFFMVEMERTKFTSQDPRIALRISYEEKLIENFFWIDVLILCKCKYYQREDIIEEFKLFWNEEDLKTSDNDTSMLDEEEEELEQKIIELEMELEESLENIDQDDVIEFVELEDEKSRLVEHSELQIHSYRDSVMESSHAPGVKFKNLKLLDGNNMKNKEKILRGDKRKHSDGFVKSMADGSLYVESLKSHDGPNDNFQHVKNITTQKEKKLTQLNNYIIYCSTFDLYAAAEKKISKIKKEQSMRGNKKKKAIKTFMVPQSEAMKTFQSDKNFSSFMPEFKPPLFAKGKKLTVIESVIDLSHLKSSIETVKTKFCEVEYELKIYLSKEPCSLGKEVYCRDIQFLKTANDYLNISDEKLTRLMKCIQLQIDDKKDVIMLPYANIKLV